VLGLSSEYANYYDGWALEEEIEAMGTWDGLASPPHPSIECTKYFAATGEDFGVVGDDEWDTSRDEAADRIADSFIDGSWDALMNTDDDTDAVIRLQQLTASASWVAEKLRRKRGAKRVSTAVERDFFRKHYTSYQGKGTEEADNFSSIQWGQFALFWNLTLKDEDEGRRPVTDMTYKNAFMLMSHFQLLKTEGNIAATSLPVNNANKDLRRLLRGPGRDTSVSFTEETPRVLEASVNTGKRVSVEIPDPLSVAVAPEIGDKPFFFENAGDESEEEVPQEAEMARLVVQPFAGKTPQVDPIKYYQTKKPTKARKRCRDCGMAPGDGDWTRYHRAQENEAPGIFYTCKTPDSKRCKGFPVLKGKRLPPRKKG
jgi:hypothetical protein